MKGIGKQIDKFSSDFAKSFSKGEKKNLGLVYTPYYIAQFIVNRLAPKETDVVLDPSCGCGVFLVAVLDYFVTKYNKNIKQALKENIRGIDIRYENIRYAQQLLFFYASEKGVILEGNDLEETLYCLDSIDNLLDENGNPTFMVADVVVGNPPYVKYQDMHVRQRDYILSMFSSVGWGNCNLFHVFIELGYRVLRDENSRMGYIVPRTWMINQSGRCLREYLVEDNKVDEVIDFQEQFVFENAMTYTSLLFLSKRKHKEFVFYYEIPSGEADIKSFLSKVENGNIEQHKQKVETLTFNPWLFEKNDVVRMINNSLGVTLGERFNINVGLATLLDYAYIIDKDVDIEEEVTMPFIKVSEIQSQVNIPNVLKRIIYPYNKETLEPIPEDEMKVKYPKAYARLLSFKDKLMLRDKGKKVFEPFYVYGRTQAMKPKEMPCLLFPVYMSRPKFYLVNEPNLLFASGYCISKKENTTMPMSVLQKILSSKPVEDYMKSTSNLIKGGFALYQKANIVGLKLPIIFRNEMETFEKMSDKNEIDEFILNCYKRGGSEND